jgi:hypothetical protein
MPSITLSMLRAEGFSSLRKKIGANTIVQITINPDDLSSAHVLDPTGADENKNGIKAFCRTIKASRRCLSSSTGSTKNLPRRSTSHSRCCCRGFTSKAPRRAELAKKCVDRDAIGRNIDMTQVERLSSGRGCPAVGRWEHLTFSKTRPGEARVW